MHKISKPAVSDTDGGISNLAECHGIAGRIRNLANAGGFLEIFGGPQSGKTYLAKEYSRLIPGRTVIVCKDRYEYSDMGKDTLIMAKTDSAIVIPALQELLLRRVVSTVIIDQIQDIGSGERSLSEDVSELATQLLLPVYQNNAVAMLINNDSFVSQDGAKILASPAGRILSTLCDLHIYKPNARCPGVCYETL